MPSSTERSRTSVRSSAATQRRSNATPALLMQETERRLVAPRAAIDAGRDERVVHVADGEDARLEVELCVLEPARVAGPVQALMVVEDEPPDGGGEVTELAEQLVSPFGVPTDDRVLLVSERAGLRQDPVGDGQLADIVQQAARGQASQACRREAELLSDLNGEKGDPPSDVPGRRRLRREGRRARRSRWQREPAEVPAGAASASARLGSWPGAPPPSSLERV